jgi:hypothetical protein
MPVICFGKKMQGMWRVTFLLLLALAAQGAFWQYSRTIVPEMRIVPDVPGEATMRALSFGDEEAFFRLNAFHIQNAGDTFGRFTALYKYDFSKLSQWFQLLGKLNNESNYLPAMASYYFSQTQNRNDVRYMVDYLDAYTAGRVKEKWWWVVQGVYLAQHKMKDLDRAAQLAERLRGVRGIPIWAQQMPAFIHEGRGEFGAALAIMQDILKHPEDFSQGELAFMRTFIDERLHKLDEVKSQLDAIAREQKKTNVPMSIIELPPPDVGAPVAPAMPGL